MKSGLEGLRPLFSKKYHVLNASSAQCHTPPYLAAAVHVVLVDDVLDLLFIGIDAAVVLQVKCGTVSRPTDLYSRSSECEDELLG